MIKAKKRAGRPAKIKKPIEKPQAPARDPAPDQVQPDQVPAPDQVQPDQAPAPAPAQSSVILENEIEKIIPAQGQDAAIIPDAPVAGISAPGQAPVCTQEDIDSFAGAVLGLFDVIAIRAGDHWKLEPPEAKSIGKPLAKVFFKYLPNFKHSDEMFLALAVGGIVLPRIKQTIELNNTEPGTDKTADQLAADNLELKKLPPIR